MKLSNKEILLKFFKKNHEGLIPGLLVLATFGIISLSSAVVNTTQFQTSSRAFDGKCNITVNKGCYEGGCRAWEACDPGSGMCQWKEESFASKKLTKCESDPAVKKPGSGTQPTQVVNQPVTQAPQAATPKPGQCDDVRWFCLG